MTKINATEKRRQLRKLLAQPEAAMAPSCGDVITARLIESLGFPALHLSGSSLHRQAGYPDAGLLTMTEMVAAVALICNAIAIPVVADADTGFGGLGNVVRTVQEYERAGAAAMHLEDQLTPKRPPTGGESHTTISRKEMVDKIRAAVDARMDEEFVIIARCEVKGNRQEVIDRLGECLDAGADAAWISGHTPEDVKALRAALHKPLVGVLHRETTLEQYSALGANSAFMPSLLETVASYAKKQLLEELLRTGTVKGYLDTLPGIDEMRKWVSSQGAAELHAIEERFGGL